MVNTIKAVQYGGREAMNYIIGHALNKNNGVRPAPGSNLCVATCGRTSGAWGDSIDPHSLRDTSMPWEILEAAHSLFQKKGFERTSIAEICGRLDIKPFEFHNHFNS